MTQAWLLWLEEQTVFSKYSKYGRRTARRDGKERTLEVQLIHIIYLLNSHELYILREEYCPFQPYSAILHGHKQAKTRLPDWVRLHEAAKGVIRLPQRITALRWEGSGTRSNERESR